MDNQVVVRSLDQAPLKFELQPGVSIAQLIELAEIPNDVKPYVVVLNHGTEITDWSYITKDGDALSICIVPQGGGGGNKGAIIGTIAIIAIAIAAPYAAAAILGTTVATLGAAGTALAMGITMVGALAVNALIPPPQLSQNSMSGGGPSEANTYSLTGQSNTSNAYGVVPRVYGTHKMFPHIASTPLIDNSGISSMISTLYDFGAGDLDVGEIFIGETPATQFDARLRVHQNTATPNLQYVYSQVAYEQMAYTLATTGDEVRLRTKPGSKDAAVDILFPEGLVRINEKNGEREAWAIDLWVEWRELPFGGFQSDNTYWHGCTIQQTAYNAYSVVNNTLRPFVVGVHMTFPRPGVYEVRVYRHSAKPIDEKVRDVCRVTMLKSFAPGNVVNLQIPHTMVELQVVASDKLSGTVSNLSATVTSRLRGCSVNGFTGVGPTRNPAHIILDVLTGASNPKPLSDNQIDFASFYRLAQLCDEQVTTTANGITSTGPRYTCDTIVNYRTTVQQLCASILSGCRAQLMITQSGKYGILIDNEQPVSRQMFTPENSWGFKGNRQFIDAPHAFRVTFTNPQNNWAKDEFLCYNDGYNASNATRFETLETFGLTDYATAWRYARYMMAQGIHRSEVFTINVDVENLAVQRGERVSIAHDVPSVGGMAMRIVQVWNDHRIVTSQKLDVGFTDYTVRLHDGTIRTGKIQYIVEPDQFDIDTTAGIVGDELIVLGMSERVVFDYLILEITPGADLTAEIKLVPYVPGIYRVDTDPIPDWKPNFGDDGIGVSDLEVIDLTAKQKIYYPLRMPMLHVNLEWKEAGTVAFLDKYQVFLLRPGYPALFVGDTPELYFTHVIDILREPELTYPCEYEIIPISKLGTWGKSAKIAITPLLDREKPQMPQNFNVNIQSETAVLFWSKTLEPDVIRYEIRYTSELIAPDWNASQHLATMPWDATRTTAGARTGTYMIRAIDSSGNKSDVAMQRTTVESLPNIEIITAIDDADFGWLGPRYGLTQIGNSLWSEGEFGNVTPEGVYMFTDLVNLDEVYEVRVSSKIRAYGEDYYDLMSTWNTLAEVPALARADSDEWDAWLEYRTVQEVFFMDSWENLEYLPDLVTGTSPWSEWRSLNVGDITARLIQFRIQTRSYTNTVRVVLTSGRTEIDVADRIWSANDVVVTPFGLRINFDPAFMFNDIAVAVNIDGNDQPVVSRVTNKGRTGFDLDLFDTTIQKTADGKVDIMVRGQGRQREVII